MKKSTVFLALLAALGSAGTAVAAEEEGRTLRDRIKSVTSRLYLKSGRLELTVFPMTSLSLNDAFYQKLGGGLGVGYYFTESLGVQLLATYSLNLETSNASYYGRKDEYIPFAGKRSILVGADFVWAPLYGKVNLASEYVMHFDTYLMGGIGLLGAEQTSEAGSSSFGFAASVGLGLRFFFTRMIALKLELKDYLVFNDTVSFRNQERGDVQQQLLFNLGLCLFLLEGDVEE
ncbi:MAG: outer membrane beta-barrel domain-containing protein [Deltaproteobacteria bacterium]|nr:outer membrane beta-barrel domain-containing protein [Deltaproteobacteria bacterium]